MLREKKVLVTGGSGAIGSAICRAAARHGADVACSHHRHPERTQALMAELSGLGVRTLTGTVDGREPASVDRFVAEVEQTFGRIDVLVNNLGATQVLPFALIEPADWDEMMTTNVRSMFLFCKAAVRGMIRRRSGAILNLGSIAGHRLLEVPVHYATAKAAVMGFTTSLAKELGRYGIRVNAVLPGLITGGVGDQVSDRQLKQYVEYCALGRAGSPEEVAELVAFLVSDRASYVNAQCLVVDGGL